MKAAIVTAPGKLEVQDIPLPVPGPYDCLVKIEACAVCSGTDTAVINDHFPSRAPYPLVLGHESAGKIIEVGP
jgi:D-arabinose 1-dehydrogenase-like Zn-dependent alcohol dehydrogenase